MLGGRLRREQEKEFILYILFILFTLLLSSCSNINHVIIKIDHDPSLVSKALDISMSTINKEYLWGGNGPEYFDCSGLIVFSYQNSYNKIFIFNDGVNIVDDVNMDMIYRFNTRIIEDINEVIPGDIVFITSDNMRITHGGLVISIKDDFVEFINASSHYNKVMIDKWHIKEMVRDQWIAGFGRMQYSRY